MADITIRKIRDEDFVQEAELRIPIDNHDEVKKAFEVIGALRKRALEHLAVDDENADYTAIEYKAVEDGAAVLVVAQVNI